jgi:hypothetical protein
VFEFDAFEGADHDAPARECEDACPIMRLFRMSGVEDFDASKRFDLMKLISVL